ncbi:hypothetical protein BDF20DRAFT_875241 [Mycotypha africana]|uniref:uncharacterized protein n=1 Tax=Mycotypha africana TaxID=64632 RepID=UPI00230158D7|nr:uncharacterized protein BDF20DRAFT_875241 [Mycotypha africana]KAI8977503.1 hypothetical protein BDF20DRAFT_875241 [Mycotypha africana]
MHHFYGNPLSLFLPLLELDKDAMASTVSEWLTEGILNEHHMTHVRMLRSIKSYVESLVARQEVQKAMRVLEDDDYVMKAIVPELLTDIKTYQIQFKLGIHLLELLQSQFPNFGFFATHRQKSKRILLLDALQATTEEGMAGSELTKALIALIRGISEKHIGTLLQQMRALFEKEDYREVNEAALKELFGWEVRLEHLAQADRDTVARMDRKARLLEGLVLPGAQTARQTATAQRVQENSIEHLRNKGTAIAKLAMDIADWCERTLRLYLRPYTTLPLHELIYYNTISLHEKAFAAQPRATIQTALTQSGHYLGCSCCRMDKADQILFSEHDTCILYKLYLECGRMINLYDWFIAFGCIIEREQRPIKQKLEENEVQARFIRSVAELQFLGFIKPTQRKTDHVIRLTWSNI